MAYHESTHALVNVSSPKNLGAKLGKLAVAKGLSVVQTALITGASRSTVYSWFAGNPVTNAYKHTVTLLIQKLRTSSKEQIMELQKRPQPLTPFDLF